MAFFDQLMPGNATKMCMILRARCTFVDVRGVRCRATTALELHHERPFARRGPATPENIRLRCRAHNELAAEQDFGRELMLTKKRGRTPPDMPPG